jgi:hypothetical protein
MIKPQARPMPIPTQSNQGSVEEQDMAKLGAEQAPEEEVAQAKGMIENIVSYVYGDGAGDIISQMPNGAPKELGTIAGNLVTNEIALEEEEGKEIEMMAEIVHELTDLAMHEGAVNLPDEKSEQTFMGEALTFAITAAMDSDDPQVNNESMMRLVTGMLGAEEQQQANGIPMPQEMMNGEA